MCPTSQRGRGGGGKGGEGRESSGMGAVMGRGLGLGLGRRGGLQKNCWGDLGVLGLGRWRDEGRGGEGSRGGDSWMGVLGEVGPLGLGLGRRGGAPEGLWRRPGSLRVRIGRRGRLSQ